MSERYMYRVPDRNGEFRRVSTGWEEYQNLVRTFAFLEEARSFDAITLRDPSRDIRVLLPLAGGQAFFRRPTDPDWVRLFTVDRVERNFTPAQRTQLAADCQTARTMLDRVIGRLAEVAIVPTPSLTLMRRAVRNIFHIVTDPFRDRPMLSSSRTCWRTSRRFARLASTRIRHSSSSPTTRARTLPGSTASTIRQCTLPRTISTWIDRGQSSRWSTSGRTPFSGCPAIRAEFTSSTTRLMASRP